MLIRFLNDDRDEVITMHEKDLGEDTMSLLMRDMNQFVDSLERTAYGARSVAAALAPHNEQLHTLNHSFSEPG